WLSSFVPLQVGRWAAWVCPGWHSTERRCPEGWGRRWSCRAVPAATDGRRPSCGAPTP
ncbi:MAG: hypothetical protein AVDCRST_MAG52-1157, partial [uncultured Blastococcus sp.]